MTSSLTKSLGLLVAAAIVSAAASAQAADEEKFEHCYGVAKAGQNDCQTSTHICAGKSVTDRDQHAFISVPAGTCSKIAGGTTTEPAVKK
jgi:uncharacterized membrane protein